LLRQTNVSGGFEFQFLAGRVTVRLGPKSEEQIDHETKMLTL
jgi:hypothetical protein